MHKLLRGVCQFQQDSFPQRQALYERLSRGQNPQACFITCADSRIDPLLLTGCEPGDLFVIRNAGNLVPPPGSPNNSEAAAIEVALSVGVKDIIVCGHSLCGAMNELLEPHGSWVVRDWLKHASLTRSRAGGLRCRDAKERLWETVKINVLVQLSHLARLPAVAERVESGALRLHGWAYRIETGDVLSYDAPCDEFVPIHPLELASA